MNKMKLNPVFLAQAISQMFSHKHKHLIGGTASRPYPKPQNQKTLWKQNRRMNK